MNNYDVAVIGAGHAGCEAALAASRLGVRVVIFSVSLDAIANMPCNPAIGGTAKGHLVREIDALGGEMGKVADATFIQMRMLNKSKGPAVHSLRAQMDKQAYQAEMKRRLERQENLSIKQAEIVDISREGDSWRLTTGIGGIYMCKAVILATGTFLDGKIIIGEVGYSSGPDGLHAVTSLTGAIRRLEIPMMRFKTGTPPRVNRNSINFSRMTVQYGDEEIVPFSFEAPFGPDRCTSSGVGKNKIPCHITYTTEKTHQIIRNNLYRSPMHSGMIEGVGARYCPSIEDKIVRFPDKESHQLFIEPMGLSTDEMYIQGLSSALPEEVQTEIVHSIPGLENAEIMRPAYAIEYDCIDPAFLSAALEFKDYPGLFAAGQICGSSGYEEAAAQGLLVGINAARLLQGKEPVTLTREESYIGVLIDDLVTKGTNEPYRMLTARAEFRLLLRQDNADMRLTPLGHDVGLISRERYGKFLAKRERIEGEIARLKSTHMPPGISLVDHLRRPEVRYYDLPGVELPKDEALTVETEIKYEGYINRQKDKLKEVKRMENFVIPRDMDYTQVTGIRIEAREKLMKIQPATVGQASRISGVNPADVTCLLMYLKTM